MTLRTVARAARQHVDVPLQPRKKSSGREQLDPRHGKLDDQGQPVQPPAEGEDGHGVVYRECKGGRDRLRARDEQAHGGDAL